MPDITAHALELERLSQATAEGVPFKRKRGRPPGGAKKKLHPDEYTPQRRRMRKRCTTRMDKFSPHAQKRREQCATPEWRANMEEKVWGPRRRGEMKGARFRVPDGFTKKTAPAMWAKAETKAEFILSKLKEKGIVDYSNLPTDDAERAELAMKELLTIGMSESNVQHKVAALSQVLKYCKTAPARSSKVTIESAEAWLAAAVADDDADGPDETSEGS